MCPARVRGGQWEAVLETLMTLVLIVLVVGGLVVWSSRRQAAARARELADAKAEARRWVERLGGQVLNLTGTDEASRQALADAAERYTAAGSQLDQATTPTQCRLATQTALEGLYYVRAARTAMGLDPGPKLPDLAGQRSAGRVTEEREVDVAGRHYVASPHPNPRTPHYYPGGVIAGRPVPQGWYSEPWWKPALVAGAWGVGSALLFSTLFAGMVGVPAAMGAAYADGFHDGAADGGFDGGDQGGGDFGDGGGDWDFGGMDFGGFGDF